MGAIVATEVSAGKMVLSGGFLRRLFTASTVGASDTVDLAAYFENVYYVRSWDVGDGTDVEAFCTAGTYLPALTLTQNKGAVYIEVIGTALKSTGGST